MEASYKTWNGQEWKLMEALKQVNFVHLKDPDTAFQKVRESTFYAFVRTILFLERNTSRYFLVMKQTFAGHGIFELSIKCLVHSYHSEFVKQHLPSRPHKI